MHLTRTREDSGAGGVPEERSTDNTSSEQPAIAPILALHRHHDGYIAFAVARDAGEDFRPLISIRRDELARYFPEFREQLLKDYVSINAGWRLRRHGSDGAAYGYPLHRTDRLRYLCASRMPRMLDQTISDRLDVTPSEAALLEKLRPATRFKPKDPAPPGRCRQRFWRARSWSGGKG